MGALFDAVHLPSLSIEGEFVKSLLSDLAESLSRRFGKEIPPDLFKMVLIEIREKEKSQG